MVAAPAPPATPAEPAVKHPLPAPENQEPLPSLNDSDEPMQNAIAGLIGKESVEQFVISKDLVRHIVVSVDNLTTEEKVAERIRPMKPVPGKSPGQWRGSDDAQVLDPANYERYKPLVQLIGSMDNQQLVATYTRYYPLFQEAYESLGHPPQYFNDRLIEVIDHLLATPELDGSDRVDAAERAVRICGSEAGVAIGGAEGADPHGQRQAPGPSKNKLRELRSELATQRQ